MITRRVLTALGLLALAPFPGAARAASGGPRLGPPEPMDLDRLKALASSLRDRPSAPPPEAPGTAALDALTYGPLQEIRYPPGRALFADSPYPVTFFHLGNLFRHPVSVYALEGGQARAVLYANDLFTYPPGNPAKDVPDGAGFAGFRFQKAPAGQPGDDADWLAFLGASYFRAGGATGSNTAPRPAASPSTRRPGPAGPRSSRSSRASTSARPRRARSPCWRCWRGRA